MENNQNDYHVSFFKPVSEKARKNRNMTLWLVAIWAVAIFGFQILLKVVGKEVPEPEHTQFMQVWNNVQSGNADEGDLVIFSKSTLQVLAKLYIKPQYKAALENAYTWALYSIEGDESGDLNDKVVAFQEAGQIGANILDANYLAARQSLENHIASLLELSSSDARRVAIPHSVKPELKDSFSSENMTLTASAMDLYLVHNRSFLTNTKFLGFPFHYFYTAVFLLILFIGICWLYCVKTDAIESTPQKS